MLIGQDRPRPLFWLFRAAGSTLVAGHAWLSGGLTFEPADLLMLAAIVTCGMGYAVGGKLTRRLGSVAVISWGAGAVAAGVGRRDDCALAGEPGGDAAVGLGGIRLCLGVLDVRRVLFWYRGLALGGAARVGQLQLFQTFAGLGLAALLLGEAVGWSTWAVAGGVALSVFAARRTA